MPQLFVLCEYPTLNGGERSMLATFDGLRQSDWSITVMAPRQGPLTDILAAKAIEHVPFNCRTTDGQRLPQSRLREHLAEVLRARRPALLHANSLAMGRLSGPVALESHVPSLSHIRDIVGLSRQAVDDVNCHARLLAVSHATRDYHVVQGLAAQKTHVLYNGIDLQRFRPRPATGYLHRELGLDPNALLLGTIGQIGLRKGQDVLLAAAKLNVEHLPNVHYLIIGERNSDKAEAVDFERELSCSAEKLLPSRVHFLGRRDDILQLLHELTLLVHPARQEPLGRVLLEAAASGVAVVANDVGGTAEIFPHETNAARLVPPDDPESLAAAILNLLHNPAKRSQLAAAARCRVEDQFSAKKAVEGLLAHYQAVLSGG